MRSSESLAHFFRLVQQVFILVPKSLGFSFANRRLSLIGYYFIVLFQYEIDISFKFLIEPLKIGGQTARWW